MADKEFIKLPYLDPYSSRGEFLIIFKYLAGVKRDELNELCNQFFGYDCLDSLIRAWSDEDFFYVRKLNKFRGNIVRAESYEELYAIIEHYSRNTESAMYSTYKLMRSNLVLYEARNDSLNVAQDYILRNITSVSRAKYWSFRNTFPEFLSEKLYQVLIGDCQTLLPTPKRKNILRLDAFGSRCFLNGGYSELKNVKDDESLISFIGKAKGRINYCEDIIISKDSTFVVDGENFSPACFISFIQSQVKVEAGAKINVICVHSQGGNSLWKVADNFIPCDFELLEMGRIISCKSLVDIAFAIKCQQVLSETTNDLYLVSSDSDMFAITRLLHSSRIHVVLEKNSSSSKYLKANKTHFVDISLVRDCCGKLNRYVAHCALVQWYLCNNKGKTLETILSEHLCPEPILNFVWSACENGVDICSEIFNYKGANFYERSKAAEAG